MIKLIMIRHGETEYQIKGLLDGQIDTRLTEKGITQVKNLAKHLKGERIEVIYCSPLQRSKLTAEIIKKELKLEAPIIKINEFKEIDCGLCRRIDEKEIKKRFPKIIRVWHKEKDPPFPKGENLKSVEKRTIPILKKLIQKNKTILISGHGALNLAIIGYFLSIPYGQRWRIKQSNACINEIKFTDKGPRIIKINYASQ